MITFYFQTFYVYKTKIKEPFKLVELVNSFHYSLIFSEMFEQLVVKIQIHMIIFFFFVSIAGVNSIGRIWQSNNLIPFNV